MSKAKQVTNTTVYQGYNTDIEPQMYSNIAYFKIKNIF